MTVDERPQTGAPAKTSRYNLMTSLALVAPLFLIYHVGVLITWPYFNGADFITSFLIRHLSTIGYLAFMVAVSVVLITLGVQQGGKERVQVERFIPLLLESAVYAFFLGSVIIFVMMKVFRMSPPGMGAVDNLIMSAGAGVHEELLFRLIIMNGLVAIFTAMKFGKIESFLSALIFSSTLFSAVHHMGALGDPWSFWVFVFRVLAGIVFGVIYWYRGFAVAVYTHALYDVYVLIFRK